MDACVSAGAGLAHRTAPALPGTGQRVHGALQGLVERSLRMLGPAGVEAPLTILRNGRKLDVKVTTADRNRAANSPRLH